MANVKSGSFTVGTTATSLASLIDTTKDPLCDVIYLYRASGQPDAFVGDSTVAGGSPPVSGIPLPADTGIPLPVDDLKRVFVRAASAGCHISYLRVG